MNLKNIPDQSLLDKTKDLVGTERQLLTEILHHLREIERRRLFSKLGCSSLFTYCTEVLKYSESQAQRRISAMRLLKELPQIESRISSGALSLTNLAQAQSFFKKEFSGVSRKEVKNDVNSAMKLDVLKKLENSSSRQCLKTLLSLSSNPENVFVERERPISSELTEIRFAASEDLLSKINRLKGLLAHSHPNMNTADLVSYLCDHGIQTIDPIERDKVRKKKMERENGNQPEKLKVKDSGRVLVRQKKEYPGADRAGNLDKAPLVKLGQEQAQELKKERVPKQKVGSQKERKSRSESESGSRSGSRSESDWEAGRGPEQHKKYSRGFSRDKAQLLIGGMEFDQGSTPKWKRVKGPKQSQERGHRQREDLAEKGVQNSPSAPKVKRRPHIQLSLKGKIWLKAGGKCEICRSSHFLEVDHIQPVSCGGESGEENLRLLCRSCNQRSAIENLGIGFMEQYLG